jgi:hypothetical protein
MPVRAQPAYLAVVSGLQGAVIWQDNQLARAIALLLTGPH